MATTICKQNVNVDTEQEVIILVDGFGRKRIEQYPLDYAGRDAALAEVMAEMNQKEEQFAELLRARGISPEKYRQKPSDCGCGN